MADKQQRLTQIFRNNTAQPMFINLEPSTSRYCIGPSEELLLYVDPSDLPEIEFAMLNSQMELFVYTGEMEMFHRGGREAEKNFEYAP